MKIKVILALHIAIGYGTLTALPSEGANLLLTNDDGYKSPGTQALYRELRRRGHSVVLSAPFSNQSGSSANITFLQPLTSPSKPEDSQAKLPPVGRTNLGDHQFYVNGSPATAVLYGIDVVGPQTWNARPDLVISGPNQGNNLGALTIHSGTLGAAVTALSRGIPAIAVSAHIEDQHTQDLLLVAAITANVVEAVLDSRTKLGSNIGLNVNIPEVDAKAQSVNSFSFSLTHIGHATSYGPAYYENLSDNELARARGIDPTLKSPGIGLLRPYTAVGIPSDDAPSSEANQLRSGDVVTISAIESTFSASDAQSKVVAAALEGILQISTPEILD